MAQAVRDIRRRIKAVRSTQQITRAMQMVAAARLRKAQGRALSARAYSEKLDELLERLTADEAHIGHSLLDRRPVRRATVIAVTADRGLAGSYNTNLFRRVEACLAALVRDITRDGVEILVVGRKGRDYLRRRGWSVTREEIGVPDDDLGQLAREFTVRIIDTFSRGATDEVLVVYSRFVSPLVQRPEVLRLLPVASPEPASETGDEEATAPRRTGAGERPVEQSELEYVYEPSPRTVYSLLLPKFVTNQLFHALLEARASEYAARMTAMKAATDNADDLIEKLTLEMHHARQTSITREIMELVGGAEALEKR